MSLHERGEWRNGWFVVPWDVTFRDIDAFGHVNNAVFLTYFEHARTLWWFSLTGVEGATEIGFIVARAEIDFKRQLNLEPIEIRMRIGALGTSSIETLYELRKQDGKEIAATGRVVVVLYDWARQSKTAIDDDLRRKLAACNSRAES